VAAKFLRKKVVITTFFFFIKSRTGKEDRMATAIAKTLHSFAPKAPIVRFSKKAWLMCWAFVHNVPMEVSWMGRMIEKTNEAGNIEYLVDEVFLLKQQCGPSETEIDPAALGALISTLPPEDMNRIRFWGHSHVKMAVFWSGVDLAAMKQLRGGGVNLYVVFNQHNQYTACIDVCDGIHDYRIDDIPIYVEETSVGEMICKFNDDLAAKYGLDPDQVYQLLQRFAREANIKIDDDMTKIPDDIDAFAKAEIAEKVSKRKYAAYVSPSHQKGALAYSRYDDEWMDRQFARETFGHLPESEKNRMRLELGPLNDAEDIQQQDLLSHNRRNSRKASSTDRKSFK
jgi:hypothetical protein